MISGFMDKMSQQHLLKLAWTPIRRHILVKGKSSLIILNYESIGKNVVAENASLKFANCLSRMRGNCAPCHALENTWHSQAGFRTNDPEVNA